MPEYLGSRYCESRSHPGNQPLKRCILLRIHRLIDFLASDGPNNLNPDAILVRGITLRHLLRHFHAVFGRWTEAPQRGKSGWATTILCGTARSKFAYMPGLPVQRRDLMNHRTPAGLRVLATHRLFDPLEAEVAECFQALATDPVYVAMCRNQHCFRARVSAKPWRIGIGGRLKPRPGVWPIAPKRMPERRAWLERYDRVAAGFAACRYIESIGGGASAPAARAVQELHDELCQARSNLPIA